MAWQDAAISVLSTVFIIFHFLSVALTSVARFVLALLYIASWPISALYKALVFVFAPVTCTIRFIISPFFYILSKFPRLEPFYIYFGSATFLGIIFGLILTLTSSGIFAVLGLYDSPDNVKTPYSPRSRHSPPSYMDGDEDASDQHQRPTTPLLDGSEQDKLEALLSSLSSPDSDLGGLAMQGWRDSPNTRRKRRSATALRIGTILEEDDSS